MNSRERFHKAVNHEEPDRVPIDYWTTSAAYRNLRDHLGITAKEDQEWGIMEAWKISEEMLRRLHVDFRRVYMNQSSSFELKTYPDGSTDTEYGFRGKYIGLYWEVIHFPWAEFTEVEQVEEYPWPDADDPSRMEGVLEWGRLGLLGEAHRPALTVYLSAWISAVGVLITWAFTRKAFNDASARLAGWIVALLPEAVLLGATQMREPFMILGAALALYGYVLLQKNEYQQGIIESEYHAPKVNW